MNREDLGLFDKICAGLVLCLLLSISYVAAFGVSSYLDFLKGPAASWIQAFGSIVTIYAAYWLGQDSHRKQIIRSIEDERARNRLKIQAVKSIMEYVLVLDRHVAGDAGYSTTYKELERLAMDAREMLSGAPLFDLPHEDLVKSVMIARGYTKTYCEHYSANIRAAPIVAEHSSLQMRELGKAGMSDRLEAIKICNELLIANAPRNGTQTN